VTQAWSDIRCICALGFWHLKRGVQLRCVKFLWTFTLVVIWTDYLARYRAFCVANSVSPDKEAQLFLTNQRKVIDIPWRPSFSSEWTRQPAENYRTGKIPLLKQHETRRDHSRTGYKNSKGCFHLWYYFCEGSPGWSTANSIHLFNWNWSCFESAIKRLEAKLAKETTDHQHNLCLFSSVHNHKKTKGTQASHPFSWHGCKYPHREQCRSQPMDNSKYHSVQAACKHIEHTRHGSTFALKLISWSKSHLGVKPPHKSPVLPTDQEPQ